jgi:hypothetical protein
MSAFSVLLVPLKVTDSAAWANEAVNKNITKKLIAVLRFIEDHLLSLVLEGDNQETGSNKIIETGGLPSPIFNGFGLVEECK